MPRWESVMNIKPFSWIKHISASPRFLVALFVTLSVLMIASALIELQQGRRELMDVMEQQAHTLLESVLAASDNALNATDEIRDVQQRRLFDNADVVRRLYEEGLVDNSLLATLRNAHHLHDIRIVSPDGEVIFRSQPSNQTPDTDREALDPIFRGDADTLILGMQRAQNGHEYRYVIALASRDRNAILVSIDAGQMLAFEQEIGFGSLLRRVADHPGIVYAALQSPDHILAAGGDVQDLEPIEGSSFLTSALFDSLLIARERIYETGNMRVLEVVLPFFYRDVPVGLFRLGVSLEPLSAINAQAIRRMIVITLVILAIGFVVVTYILARQNAEILEKQYQAVETYSSRVIEHVSDGIVVCSKAGDIRTINRAAQEMFDVSESEVLNRPASFLLGEDGACLDFLHSPALLAQLTCERPQRTLHLLGSKSTFTDERGELNTLLVLRDMTRQKQLESQLQEQEKLSEMGEMAGGLAHEIRNPLNAVGTIVQQLRKDFHPVEDAEEYDELMEIVYQEVRRINDSVQNFLRMVRPEPVRASLFPLKDLLQFIHQEYASTVAERRLHLDVLMEWEGDVYWDRRQMQQVFMNLVQNAIEAVDQGGHIKITVTKTGIEEVEFTITDNGAGIPESIRNRIFNLYFTTKRKGTGIGLSLVQRIVNDHGGVIEVESEEGKGTSFILRIPQWARQPEVAEGRI